MNLARPPCACLRLLLPFNVSVSQSVDQGLVLFSSFQAPPSLLIYCIGTLCCDDDDHNDDDDSDDDSDDDRADDDSDDDDDDDDNDDDDDDDDVDDDCDDDDNDDDDNDDDLSLNLRCNPLNPMKHYV
ncbi:hypothetical protein ElyMa_001545900 [Elysia marginata]|uniref:Uncharacterized protein n=1 Tax=Elysia marginata TaxID=1093978 RepID=A0AAV4JAX0_9GAST|nr:hypothetical protein ElyMa_001545900 [Elysia marginata]